MYLAILLLSRKRFACAAVLLSSLALVLTTHAQVIPGDYLRLKLQSGYRVEGRIYDMKPDTVTVVVALEPLSIPLDTVIKAEYLAGKASRRVTGALIGLGMGALIAVAAVCSDGCKVRGFDDVAVGLTATGFVSLPTVGLGVLIGSFVKRDRWEPISLSDQLQAGLTNHGGIGIRLVF